MKNSVGLPVILVLLGAGLLSLSIPYLTINPYLGWMGLVSAATVVVGGVLGIVRHFRAKRERS